MADVDGYRSATRYSPGILGSLRSVGSKLCEKIKISTIFYNYGLNCARHSYLLITLSVLLFCFCCYPIVGIHLFQNNFAQQFVTEFDTFRHLNSLKQSGPNASTGRSFDDASVNSTHPVNITNLKQTLRKAPPWFHQGKPHAYVMQIMVQSAVMPWKENLIIMDAIRAPIAQVFSIVETISNYQFRTDQHSISLNDVCLQIGEPIMLKHETAFLYLPRYSCLTLSPANVWKSDLNKFLGDRMIIKTIFDIKDTSSLESGSLKELLFGLPWEQTGIRKLYVRNRQRAINYAITLVFKEFNEQLIDDLQRTLKKQFPGSSFKSDSLNRTDPLASSEPPVKQTVHLYFQHQKHFTAFLPLAATYSLVLLIIYLCVRKVDLIKNKFHLAFFAVLTIVMSLLSSIGICFWFDFNPTLNGSDILPYLVLLLGVGNVAVPIKSIASTQDHLEKEVRIAQGLSKEASSILKWFAILLGLFLLGFLTFIPLIQDICLFGIAALIGDLVLQQMFFVPILASNMARTAKPPNPRGHKKNLSASKPITWMQKQLDSQSPTKVFSRPSAIPDTPVKAAKRLRLFYFVFDHRLIHMLMGLIFIGWMVYLSVISSESTLKFGSTGINETQLPDDRLASNQPTAEEKPTFEKHKFTKNKFRFSHFLSPQHWSTLFWSYNVSLSGKYITILPPLQLSVSIEPEQAIKTRHPSEPDLQIFRQYLFPKNSPFADDPIDDYEEDEFPYANFKFDWSSKQVIALTAFATLISLCILYYPMVLLYRCLCTRQYADWRSSLFAERKAKGGSLEALVTDSMPILFASAHNEEIEYLCTNAADNSDDIVVTSDLLGNVKVWNISGGYCKQVIQRSELRGRSGVNRQSIGRENQQQPQLNSGGSSLGSDTTLSSSPSNETDGEMMASSVLGNGGLNKSASNGLLHQPPASRTEQKRPENGGYNFHPYHEKANFSSNLLSKFVYDATRSPSVDLFDKIHSNDDLTSNKTPSVTSTLRYQAIWCMLRRDKLLYLGCSNGRFEVWNIEKGILSHYEEPAEQSRGLGITLMAANNQRLAIARLSGQIEIYELELKPDAARSAPELRNRMLPTSSASLEQESNRADQDYITFSLLQTLEAHKQPITCMKMVDQYLVTGSVDHLVRVFKFGQQTCSSEFTLHGHFAGITCLAIDKTNNLGSDSFSRFLVSGCQSGQICVWEFSTSACVFNMEAHNGAITEILITQGYLLSSSVDNKINIWDKTTGNLVNTIDHQYSLCHKMVIMEPYILVTANDDKLELWDIRQASRINVIKISKGQKFSLIRNLALSQHNLHQSKHSAIVCDYGVHLCLISFPQILKKFD